MHDEQKSEKEEEPAASTEGNMYQPFPQTFNVKPFHVDFQQNKTYCFNI